MKTKIITIALLGLGFIANHVAQGSTIVSNFYFTTDKSPVIVWTSSNVFPSTQYPIPSNVQGYLGLTLEDNLGKDQALSLVKAIRVTDTNMTPPITLCIINENITAQYSSNTDIPEILDVKAESNNASNCSVIKTEVRNGVINIYINVLAS